MCVTPVLCPVVLQEAKERMRLLKEKNRMNSVNARDRLANPDLTHCARLRRTADLRKQSHKLRQETEHQHNVEAEYNRKITAVEKAQAEVDKLAMSKAIAEKERMESLERTRLKREELERQQAKEKAKADALAAVEAVRLKAIADEEAIKRQAHIDANKKLKDMMKKK